MDGATISPIIRTSPSLFDIRGRKRRLRRRILLRSPAAAMEARLKEIETYYRKQLEALKQEMAKARQSGDYETYANLYRRYLEILSEYEGEKNKPVEVIPVKGERTSTFNKALQERGRYFFEPPTVRKVTGGYEVEFPGGGGVSIPEEYVEEAVPTIPSPSAPSEPTPTGTSAPPVFLAPESFEPVVTELEGGYEVEFPGGGGMSVTREYAEKEVIPISPVVVASSPVSSETPLHPTLPEPSPATTAETGTSLVDTFTSMIQNTLSLLGL